MCSSDLAPLASLPAAVGLPLQVGGLGIQVLFFLFGLLMVYMGFDEYRASRLVRDTATERVRSVAAGRTELTGAAEPGETLFHRPFTDGECLYADYSVQEESNSDDSEWTTVAADTWLAPFYLEDETGRIRVEPTRKTTFEISEDNTTTVTVEAGQAEPPEIRAFIEETEGVTPSDERRRYVERVIPQGESVYVLGGAEQREEETGKNEDRLVVRRDDGSGRFLVSDMDQSELTSTLSRRVPVLIAMGILFSAFALYGLLQASGVA